MIDLEWRPATLADVPELTRLDNALTVAEGNHDLETEQGMLDSLALAKVALPVDTLLALTPDGSVVGWGMVPPPPEGGDIWHCDGGVHPDWRGLGIGRRLLGWQLERATEQRAARGATVPWRLNIGVMDGDHQTARLCARVDMKPVRFWFEMERPLADPIAPVAVVCGLRVVEYDERYAAALHAAHMEAFVGNFGFQQRPFAAWRVLLSGESFRPRQTVLALDPAGEVAGYLLSFGFSDPTRMTMGTIGTRPAWRRQGVAAALIAAGLAAYRTANIETACLDVDSGNSTGAVGIYERMGFHVVRKATTFSRPVGS